MKWYSPDIKPEDKKWIVYCWQGENDPLDLTFHIGSNYDFYDGVLCWAYLDIEEFLNVPIQKPTQKQYTGKRLITL